MANWVTASGRTLSYLYDLAGNRTRISWPDGYFHAYVHDPLNRVSQVQENGATSGPGLLAAYTYDNRGVRITLARAGGAGASTTANGSDGSGRLVSLGQNLQAPNAVAWNFGYNGANPLTSNIATNRTYDYAAPPASKARQRAEPVCQCQRDGLCL